MKIETLKKDRTRELMIGLLLVVAVILGIVFATSRAKYRLTQTIKLAEGTIKYSAYDFQIVGIYVTDSNGSIIGKDGKKYKEIETMPNEEYTINETNSYCYIGSEETKDTEAKIYTNESGEHIISNIVKSDNCYIYFDKEESGSSIVVGDKEIKPSTGGMFNIIDSTVTTGVMYSAEDDDGTSYYYRGNPTDNWVYFGGYYWRIIRINGDGTIRMIYQGTEPNETGAGTQIGTSAFNSTRTNNMYVGYFYTDGEVHGLGTESTIYTTLNNWFAGSNIKQGSEYYDKIDTNAGFCNDREPSTTATGTLSGDVYVGNGSGGTGTTTTTYYAAYIRLLSNESTPTSTTRTITPTFKCSDKANDLFTYSGATQGNKKLANPVGLLTADEASYAGLVFGTTNTGNYLYTAQNYWTMSPSVYGNANVFYVRSTGYLFYALVSNADGVRPVINLKSSVTITGSGTTTDPYKIS